jgi:tetratricopeptide (TPR) repeat protein
MRPFHFLLLSCALFCSFFSCPTLGQVGGGHTLFGDLIVEQEGESGLRPYSFQVILYHFTSGHIYSRQSVNANGRYRFLDVRNGEYDLVIELYDREVGRIHFMLIDPAKTDIRRDIHLAWKPAPAAKLERKVETISAKEFYQRSPENEELWKDALEASADGERERAVNSLLQIVSSDRGDFQAWTELGTLRFRRGEYREAEVAYRRALETQPSYLLAMLNLGKLHIASRRYGEAIEILTRTVEESPRSSDAHYLLGETYLLTKKGSSAVKSLNEALRLDPVGKAEAHLRLGALFDRAGMKGKAAEEFESYLEKKPNYPRKAELRQYIRLNRNSPPA